MVNHQRPEIIQDAGGRCYFGMLRTRRVKALVRFTCKEVMALRDQLITYASSNIKDTLMGPIDLVEAEQVKVTIQRLQIRDVVWCMGHTVDPNASVRMLPDSGDDLLYRVSRPNQVGTVGEKYPSRPVVELSVEGRRIKQA